MSYMNNNTIKTIIEYDNILSDKNSLKILYKKLNITKNNIIRKKISKNFLSCN